MAFFFLDAVVRETLFSGAVHAPFQVCHQYGLDKDVARRRRVEDIVSHLLASGNIACFRALRRLESVGRGIAAQPWPDFYDKVPIQNSDNANQPCIARSGAIEVIR